MATRERHETSRTGWVSGDERLKVSFVRRDWLWSPPEPLADPHGEAVFELPYAVPSAGKPLLYYGPSVLHLVEKQRVRRQGGERRRWSLRPAADFFTSPSHRGKEPHPFRKPLCGSGIYAGEREGFIEVEKPTSVLVSRLVYLLTMGMQGSYDAATRYVAELAAAAWLQELERGERLYTFVRDQGGRVDDHAVPDELRAKRTVSQAVEAAILAAACRGYGVDPEQPPERRRGRPVTKG